MLSSRRVRCTALILRKLSVLTWHYDGTLEHTPCTGSQFDWARSSRVEALFENNMHLKRDPGALNLQPVKVHRGSAGVFPIETRFEGGCKGVPILYLL